MLAKKVPGFAKGVDGFGGGMAMVGEKGPELVTLPGGSNVITNKNTEALMRGGGGGGTMQVEVTGTIRGQGDQMLVVIQNAIKQRGRHGL